MPRYVPERGDIIWLELNPQAGHEQAGHRPGLVISPKADNQKVGLALICPITSRVKGYPFEVAVPQGLPCAGVVLADQIKSLDWRARKASFVAKLPIGQVNAVLGKLRTNGIPVVGCDSFHTELFHHLFRSPESRDFIRSER
jgi:mRNA interferase MazF